jgi:hypothetical protein
VLALSSSVSAAAITRTPIAVYLPRTAAVILTGFSA